MDRLFMGDSLHGTIAVGGVAETLTLDGDYQMVVVVLGEAATDDLFVAVDHDLADPDIAPEDQGTIRVTRTVPQAVRSNRSGVTIVQVVSASAGVPYTVVGLQQ